MKAQPGERKAVVGVLLGLGLVGSILVLANTPWGIGIWHDSVIYLDAADSLSKGLGLQWVGSGGALKPLTHYPPGYPLALSLVGAIGADLVEGARWLAAALFGLNIFLLGFLLYRPTGSGSLATLGSLLALASPILLDVHLEAMSEPLHLMSLLLSVGLLAEYLRRGRRWILAAAALCAASAYLVRYVGISLVGAGLLALVFWPGRPRTRRIQDTLVFGTLSLVPVSAWYVRNVRLVGSATNRIWIYHPIQSQTLRDAADTVSSWLFPRTISLGIRALLILLVGAMILALVGLLAKRFLGTGTRVRSSAEQILLTWLGLLLLNALVYMGALLFSISFLDASTRLNNRILSPLYVMTLLAACLVLWGVLGTLLKPRAVAVVCGLATLAVMASYGVRSAALLAEMREIGRGFTGRSWKTSEAIHWLQEVGPNWLVYTNEAFPVRFLTDIPAFAVPEAFDPVQSQERVDYEVQTAAMSASLRKPDSALLLFKSRLADPESVSVEEMAAGLVLVHETPDAFVYMSEADAAMFGAH